MSCCVGAELWNRSAIHWAGLIGLSKGADGCVRATEKVIFVRVLYEKAPAGLITLMPSEYVVIISQGTPLL